ncbi:ketoacyl-ACP synthase III [Clostridium sp. ATCC 25772]|uniref:ketoacyl-ACP synthase III n=1 Tax=Clostridium sp. ATCC 25772 TaxID=1676991 RepID=UPI0007859AA2|nr:ketoacyl-ACP synthase III [Clostridium sp. ATCC 25772]
MYKNVHIIGVGTYHPKKELKNQYFVEHFKKYKLEDYAEALMDKLGRDTRTIAEEGENGISMALKASRKALHNAEISVSDIDMIISVSDTPEYLSPCCALLIKNQLNAKNANAIFDMNSNCTGMLTAIDVASRYLKTDNKYKRILVVGSLLISKFAREDDIVAFGCSADGAAAIVLEKREENEEKGFLGSRMYTDDSYHWSITMPGCGMSNILDMNIDNENKKMVWKPFDFSFLSEKWTETITKLLRDYNYETKDVTHYLMSQFSRADIELTVTKLGTDMGKAIFVGNRYGYTGCTSPIMALEDKLNEEHFNKDDLIVFCSVASGYSICALLYKW